MTEKIIGITGGTGYVGSRVAIALARKGYKVVSIDIVTPEEKKIILSDGILFRHHDLRKPSEAQEALRDVDVLMHLAADIGSLSYMHDHMADIMVNNSQIDASIYPAMVACGVKHVVYSSSSMVFQHPPKFPYSESDIKHINPPTNVYGFSKLSGEYFCRAFTKQYGITHTIIRYHNIYGPGEDSKGNTPGDIHVIPALLEKVIIKKQYPIELLGSAKSTRPFTYIDDAVEATVQIIESVVQNNQCVVNEDYNVGNENFHTIEDLAQIIWALFGDERPFRYFEQETHAVTSLRREVDISKIVTNLGWRPKTSLEDGLKKTAEWIVHR